MKLFESLRILTTHPDLWALVQPNVLALLREWSSSYGSSDILDVRLEHSKPLVGTDIYGDDILICVDEAYIITYIIPEPESFKAVDKKGIPTTMEQRLLIVRLDYYTCYIPEMTDSIHNIIGNVMRHHKIDTLLLQPTTRAAIHRWFVGKRRWWFWCVRVALVQRTRTECPTSEGW